MANQSNSKMKLLYIYDMLQKYSDEQHPISRQEIEERLSNLGISCERKSIYRDIAILQDFGVDILQAPDHKGYYIGGREFELPELKLLVDAVLASKFITEKKSKELVEKIETLGSVHQGKHLHRQVVVSDRVKAENEGIYYTIDEIYNCIDNNHRLNFKYVNWNAKKELEYQHQGQIYDVSPDFLLWDNEYYYLVAYDHKSKSIRHYRVDKIRDARESNENRGGIEARNRINKADFAKKHFGMFSGATRTVRIEAPKYMVGVMIDRFGTEISIREAGDMVIVRTEVEVSSQFYGWLVGLGDAVRLIGPDEVVLEYKKYLENIISKIDE